MKSFVSKLAITVFLGLFAYGIVEGVSAERAPSNSITICSGPNCQPGNGVTQQQAGIGAQAAEFIFGLFDTSKWPARWHCGEWSSLHGWLYIISDLLIWLSYFAIPVIIGYFIYKKRVENIQFKSVAIMFMVFILACGMSHLLDAAIFWWPAYRLSAVIKMGTAAISMATVFSLVRVTPAVLEFKSPSALEKVVKERTRELELANQQLREEMAERMKTADRLRASNDELLAFSYSVSHDLRAPLRSIQGFSAALVEDYSGHTDAQGRDYMQRIHASSLRMGELIDDILKLSRLSRDQVMVEDVDLSQMAQDVISSYIQRNADVKTSFEIENGMLVRADRKLLKIAMENLIDNAIKYSSRIESPLVKVGKIRGEDVYYVEDNGVGFDMQNAGRLFGTFQRLHEGQFDGSGIGLATVRRIVQKHGGKVWADGRVNRGATFYLTLQ